MRILKVILIVFTILLLFFMSLALFHLEETFGGNSGYFIALIFAVLGFILSLLTIGYHVKSFRYYRKSKAYKKESKGAFFLRFCAVGHSVYYMLFGVLSIIGGLMSSQASGGAIISIILFVPVILFGIFSIYETILLRKRIKRLENEQETKDEIQAIGS